MWHGRGVLTQRDGTVVKANWEFGSRVSGTVKFNPETIPETYVGHSSSKCPEPSGFRDGIDDDML